MLRIQIIRPINIRFLKTGVPTASDSAELRAIDG